MNPSTKSRWSRMGSVLRRADTVWPSTLLDTDSASVKGGNTSTLTRPISPVAPSQSLHSPQPSMPSPIAESPAREAPAQEEVIPVGPSPLNQDLEAMQLSSVNEYMPPPLIDASTLRPGAFTDEPDELPQPQSVRDPSLYLDRHSTGSDASETISVVGRSPYTDIEANEKPIVTTEARVTELHEGHPTLEAAEATLEATYPALTNILTPVQENSSSPIGFCIPSINVSPDQKAWAHGGTRTEDGELNVQIPMRNPAVDSTIPKITVSYAINSATPNSHTSEQEAYSESYENENENRTTTVIPLPAFHEVISSKSNDLASIEGSKSNSFWGQFETDGNSPSGLLDSIPLLQSAVDSTNHSRTPAQNFLLPQPTADESRLQSLGWIEYQLPDASVYYAHPIHRVITDVDLRIYEKLDVIMGYLHNEEVDNIPTGMELWLREPRNMRRKSNAAQLTRYLVDHQNRTVAIDHLHESYDSRAKNTTENDDRLDEEYRYWLFMETHPAHTSLPVDIRTEAMDILSWAWTDRLLPSHCTFPAPFTKKESQELLSLLQSFSGEFINSPFLWDI